MKVLGMKMTLKNIVVLVLAVLGVLYLLNKVGVKVPMLETYRSDPARPVGQASNTASPVPTPRRRR